MTNGLIKEFRTERWLLVFVFAHLILWTMVPAVVRYNLPLDSIEGTIWGHQLEWGYDKNPFLNGWLTALATYLGGQSGWMVYLFSQLCVITCFWAVWRLASCMLPPLYALFSVMILEGIQYYNFHAIDFNDNTLELGLWALTIYYFYKALLPADNSRLTSGITSSHSTTSNKTAAWLLTGTFAGLGMMAKYYTAALLAGMALFLFSNPANRRELKTLPPYLGLGIFLVIILPHTIWLFFHDFITIRYVFERGSSGESTWTNHFFFPAQFAWQQFQAFIPALILCSFLFLGKKSVSPAPRFKLDTFNRSFLFFVGLGPFLLTILLSLSLGTKLRAGWGMPLLSTWGIILIAAAQPNITREKAYRFLTAIFLLMGVMVSGYSVSLINSSDTSSANFPGREIAQAITRQWHDVYHTRLDYVGGSRWISGNVEFYSADHPAVFIEWDKRRAPWISTQDMKNKGAVFVWDITNDESMPDEIKQQFPLLQQANVMEFSWHRNRNNLPPVKIGVAFLPPAKA